MKQRLRLSWPVCVAAFVVVLRVDSIIVVGKPLYTQKKDNCPNLDFSTADITLIAKTALAGVPIVAILLSDCSLILTDGGAFAAAWLPNSEGLIVANLTY